TDGKLLAAGNFQAIDGVPKPGLVRLNPDGSLDGGFNVTGITAGISVVSVLPGGRILVGGSFSLGGNKYLGLARLNATGTVDPSLQAATSRSYGAIYEM